MLEEDISLRVMAMKCWGEVFRSELGPYATNLLKVQVSHVTVGDVVMQMKMDLWKYERGGMYLLEDLAWSGMSRSRGSTSVSTNSSRRNSISIPAQQSPYPSPEKDQHTGDDYSNVDAITSDEAYISFLQWLDDLSEDVRDAFEEKISDEADRLRQDVVSTSADILRYGQEKWEGYTQQLLRHSRELHVYVSHLHAVKKRDLKTLQRMMLHTFSSYHSQWKRDRAYQEGMLSRYSDNHSIYILQQLASMNRDDDIDRKDSIPPRLFGHKCFSPTAMDRVGRADRTRSDYEIPSTSADDDSVTSSVFLCLQHCEVGAGRGEWALELAEDLYRRRRRVK